MLGQRRGKRKCVLWGRRFVFGKGNADCMVVLGAVLCLMVLPRVNIIRIYSQGRRISFNINDRYVM